MTYFHNTAPLNSDPKRKRKKTNKQIILIGISVISTLGDLICMERKVARRKESHSPVSSSIWPGWLVKGLEVTRIGRLYTRNFEEEVYGWAYGSGYFGFFIHSHQ